MFEVVLCFHQLKIQAASGSLIVHATRSTILTHLENINLTVSCLASYNSVVTSSKQLCVPEDLRMKGFDLTAYPRVYQI
jgi:hypothetical protein